MSQATDNSGDTELEGYVDTILFRNEENGYTVFAISRGRQEVICTGNTSGVSEGQYLDLKGSYVNHPVYGKQFSVKSYSFKEPHTSEAFLAFMSGGGLPGIGKKRAEKITGSFGDDAYRIMLEEPETLAKEIKGISRAQAYEFQRLLTEKKQENDARMFLQKFGIGAALSEKIYRFYGEKTYTVLKENPYRLAEDVKSIGFKTADDIVMRSGIQVDEGFRLRGASIYVLEKAVGAGHTYLPMSVLRQKVYELIGNSSCDFEALISDLSMEKKLLVKPGEGEDFFVYLPSYRYMEENVADRLKSLFSAKQAPMDAQCPDDLFPGEDDGDFLNLKKTEAQMGVVFDPTQREAIINGVTRGITVITGGPGTGKTTIINAIIKIYAERGMTVHLAAPTGRAAKRLSETSGLEAQTIHRLLGYAPVFGEDDMPEDDQDSRMAFEYNSENPLDTDVVIIDEMSMVDLWLMNALLNALSDGTRLIMVGDCDQLPSVGAGNVLGDIIDSGVFHVVRLETIFRQAAQSDIVSNAHRINKGEPVDLGKPSNDFLFIKRDTDDKIISAIYTLVTDKLPKYVGADRSEIQILTPSRMSKLGVERLNSIMQGLINPPDPGKKEKEYRGICFREGDKVMQIKNDYTLEWTRTDPSGLAEEGTGVYNGDTGILQRVSRFDETVTVLFDDGRRADYAFSELDELELAYAVTIHKSQGSEYPAVVIPMYPAPRMLMNRKLLYTAVTRARKCVCLVGLPDVFDLMKENQYESYRYSSLRERICERFAPQQL